MSTKLTRRRFIRILGGTAITCYTSSALGRALATTTHDPGGLLIEAEGFDELGGWKPDPQFVDVMGGVYLLAHGLGQPVPNASTSMAVAAPGRYHTWIRTKNWCPGAWEAPGRFRVHVNGKPLQPVFGTHGDRWGWEPGGVVQLSRGTAQIALEDLTGFDARCDAIYFTRNPAFRPPNETSELLKWKDHVAGRSTTPDAEHDVDVVIVGGGVAGCAAAMAASMQGITVALVHDRPVLGGNASGEIRVHTIGIHGKGAAILKQLDTKLWPNGSDAAHVDDDKRERAMAATSANIFKDHRAIGLELDGQRIASVDACETGSGRLVRFKAPVFIDCTGDGWLGYWAGADHRYGRESKNEFQEGWDKYGELWSPERPDNRVMGSSVMWNTAQQTTPTVFPPVPWAMPVAKHSKATHGDWDWEFSRNNLHQVKDAEAIRDHLLRAIFGTFSNVKKEPRHAKLALSWVAYILGKRESRRLMGDYVFTMKDADSGVMFPDTVAEESREIDVHYQLALTGSEFDFRSRAMFRKTGKYYIPFRCLYSRNVPNLMMAGRCFSCSHIGLGGPRVQNTTGQMGIATGYAAALCRKYDADPRTIGARHVAELRKLIGYA